MTGPKAQQRVLERNTLIVDFSNRKEVFVSCFAFESMTLVSLNYVYRCTNIVFPRP